jgi:ferredoxin
VKVKVDEDLCIGSGSCEQICPDVFKVIEGRSKVQVDEVPPNLEEAVREAVDACPMVAIIISE